MENEKRIITETELLKFIHEDLRIPAEKVSGLNEKAVERAKTLTEKAKELSEKAENVNVKEFGTLSTDDIDWRMAVSVAVNKDGLPVIEFDSESPKTGDTLTPLKELFATSDEVNFKICSDKRFEIEFVVHNVWNITDGNW